MLKQLLNYKMLKKNLISDEKLDKYFKVTGDALEKLSLCCPEKTPLFLISQDYLLMAKTYYEDARHFREKGDYVNAFAALNYSHGWLDAGARIGIFDVKHDSILFTVD